METRGLFAAKYKKSQPLIIKQLGSNWVRLTGLEPARRETPDPKSGASTNSATSAFAGAKLAIFFDFKELCKR